MADTGDMTAAVEAAFASASPAPATGSTDDSASVPTTAAPSTETATTETPVEPGPVPYPRFKQELDSANLSKKELEQLGWAKGIQREHGETLAAFYQRVRETPVETLSGELETLKDHPVYGPQIRSWAARMLGTRLPGAAPAVDQKPQPDVQLTDGSWVYSDKGIKALEDWHSSQMDARIDARLQPIKQSTETSQQFIARQQATLIREQANQDAAEHVAALSKNPHFEAHKADVRALMLSDPTLNLDQAWAKTFIEKVIPKLSGQQAAGLQQKVIAGSANPARPSGAAAGPPKDFREGLERLLGK